MTTTQDTMTARIHYEADCYHISNDAWDHLDTSGPGYITLAAAYRRAAELGYTHAITDQRDRHAIPIRYRRDAGQR
jgi:hypothetical protein